MAEQYARYDDGVVGQVDGLKVPRYAGLTTFARLPRLEDVDDYDVAVVGVPWDSGVTYRPGARFGPSAIRQASRLLRPYNPALDAQRDIAVHGTLLYGLSVSYFLISQSTSVPLWPSRC